MKREWLTNIEDVKALEADLARAIAAHNALPTIETAAAVRHAERRLRNSASDRALIRREMGEFVEGDPHPTKTRTTEQIAARGIVGLYRK